MSKLPALRFEPLAIHEVDEFSGFQGVPELGEGTGSVMPRWKVQVSVFEPKIGALIPKFGELIANKKLLIEPP